MAIAKSVTLNLGAEKFSFVRQPIGLIEGVKTYDINIEVETSHDATSGTTTISGIEIKINPDVISINNPSVTFNADTGVIKLEGSLG